jgi:hypothetical protein
VVSTIQFEDSTTFEPVLVPFRAARLDGQHRAFEPLGHHEFHVWLCDEAVKSRDGGTKQSADK